MNNWDTLEEAMKKKARETKREVLIAYDPKNPGRFYCMTVVDMVICGFREYVNQ